MQRPRIVGLTGLAGSGKDTVRAMLEASPGSAGMAFADPLRMMLEELLQYVDANPGHTTDRAMKEAPVPQLGGLTYRKLIQTLGTEWGRSLHSDLWLLCAEARLKWLCSNDAQLVVISDVRFPNEADWIRAKGGEIWRIERPGIVPVRAHASETNMQAIDPDHVLLNAGSIDDLWHLVKQLRKVEVQP